MFAHMPIIRDILYGAARHGANLQSLCRDLKLSVGDLSRSDSVVDFKTAYTAWEYAVSETGDKYLGLRLGTSTTPAILGIVGHLMQNCRTLHEAFGQVCAFSALATDMFTYTMTDKGEHTVLTFAPAAAWVRVSPATSRQAADQAMAGCLNVFYLLSGIRLQPERATVTHNRTVQRDRYTHIFGANVQFGAKTNTLVFLRDALQQQLQQYDRSLLFTFQALAQKQLRKRKLTKSFAGEVAEYMRYEFATEVPPLEVIASRMNMSVRTFQRRLAGENQNYRDLAEKVSKELAMSLLTSGNMRIADVARSMGYSEPSAFRRAFKRWTKSSPRKVRNK